PVDQLNRAATWGCDTLPKCPNQEVGAEASVAVRNGSARPNAHETPEKCPMRARGKSPARCGSTVGAWLSPGSCTARPTVQSGLTERSFGEIRGRSDGQVSAKPWSIEGKSRVRLPRPERALAQARAPHCFRVKSRRYKIVEKEWFRDGRE